MDDVDTFKWQGKYDLNEFKAHLMKNYPTHNIQMMEILIKMESGESGESGIMIKISPNLV